jgi:sulfhydrogenase subunit gamma (sulfur reductase)
MDSRANPYLPEIATVVDVIQETPNIKSLRVVFNDAEKMKALRFEPGQVGQLSAFGAGEATFVINSPPTRPEYLQFSIMQVGEVTQRLHQLKPGDQIGVRVPLGNGFPYADMKGRDILFIGGGIGMAPLRTLLLFMLDNRSAYGDITVIYGARSPQDLCYKAELPDWEQRDDMDLILTVDREFPDWHKRVGFVPTVLKEEAPAPDDKVAVTTLEKRMKCGIGLCGRCNIGPVYVCTDGPVFSMAQLRALPSEL